MNTFVRPQDALATQLAMRQRLEADMANARADHAAELCNELKRLAAAECDLQAANDRAQQAVAEQERLSGELSEARDAVKARPSCACVRGIGLLMLSMLP